jgi:replicative DNA helicase
MDEDLISPRDLAYGVAKIPPQALDLEEAVLGAAMLEKGATSVLVELLKPEDFYSDQHSVIFKALQSLTREGKPVDMRTIVHQLSTTNELNIAGGAYYIAELTSKVSSAANMEYHCRVLMQKSMLREIIHHGMYIAEKGYREDTDVFELIEELRKFALNINSSGAKTEKSMQEAMYAMIKYMNDKKTSESHITGIPSGFTVLDKVTSGWQDTDLIIIAARPGMGKTTIAIEAVKFASVNFKVPAAIFSMEMSCIQLTAKMASSESWIDLRKIRHVDMADFEWQQLTHKTSKLSGAPIYIDDSAGLSILELEARCRRYVDKYGIKIIVVDYIQLMRGEGRKGGNREEEVSSISRGLKRIAKSLGIPVIAISQLSRAVETRGGAKRPMLSDLRESGSLEQDADIVIFPWRPEYYKIHINEEGNEYVGGYTELHVAKHRNGTTDTVAVQFLGKFSKFRDIQIHPEPGTDVTAPATVQTDGPPDKRDDLPF